MWNKIKTITLVLLIAVLTAIIVVYTCNVDWSGSYTKSVSNLDELQESAIDGAYQISIDDMSFHTRVAGWQNEGEVIVFLHGFPESSIMWEPIMQQAASEGFRTLAFDQRGYSPNARPKGIENYKTELIIEDVISITQELQIDSFHLVGHDWGSVIGWLTSMKYQQNVISWTSMSIPHPQVFMEALNSNPEQQKRSSYIKQLQKPYIPEIFFRLMQGRLADNLSNTWRPEDVEEFEHIFREQGSITAALNWYRALALSNNQNFADNQIRVPVLFIWGQDDPVVDSSIIPLQKKFMKSSYQELKLDCGHSLIQEKPNKVIQAIMDHIREHSLLRNL